MPDRFRIDEESVKRDSPHTIATSLQVASPPNDAIVASPIPVSTHSTPPSDYVLRLMVSAR